MVEILLLGAAQQASLVLVLEMVHFVGKHDGVYHLLVGDLVVEELALKERSLQPTGAHQKATKVQCQAVVACLLGSQTSDCVEEELPTAGHGAEGLEVQVEEVETMSCWVKAQTVQK